MRGRFFVWNLKNITLSMLIISLLTILCCSGTAMVSHVIETANEKRLLPIYSVETPEKKVTITFDCAWGAEDIASIIATLQKNNVKATFFVVGTWAEKNPEAVKMMHEAGMEVGNHSNAHAHVNRMSYGEVLEDMVKCNEKIEAIIGKKVKYYRGPYGEYNNTVITVADELGMQVIQWDVDTLDYEGKTVEEICQRIQKKIRNGSIILMHNDTKHTAKGLAKIIATIHQEGYEIVPLEELVYQERYEINHEGRQIIQK